MKLRVLYLKIFVCLLLALPLAACEAKEKPVLPTEEIKIVSAGRDRATLTVELALRPKDQEAGLMGRTRLGKNKGMLFVFPSNIVIRFWMKDTLIPLDMIFIDQDGRVIKIHERAKPKDETYISSDFQVRAVLEVPAGAAKRFNLNIGDLILSPTLDRIVADLGASAE